MPQNLKVEDLVEMIAPSIGGAIKER